MSAPQTGFPLSWVDDARGYRCMACGLWVAEPKRDSLATCPRCPSIPIDETATALLHFAGFDESDAESAIDAIRPLLDALAAAIVPAQ